MAPEIAWATEAVEFLRAAGPYGAILVLGCVIYTMRNEIKDRDSQIATLNEIARREGREDGKALAAIAEGYKASAAATVAGLASSAAAINEVVDTLRPLPAAIEMMVRNQERNGERLERNGEGIGQVSAKLDRILDQRGRP